MGRVAILRSRSAARTDPEPGHLDRAVRPPVGSGVQEERPVDRWARLECAAVDDDAPRHEVRGYGGPVAPDDGFKRFVDVAWVERPRDAPRFACRYGPMNRRRGRGVRAENLRLFLERERGDNDTLLQSKKG